MTLSNIPYSFNPHTLDLLRYISQNEGSVHPVGEIARKIHVHSADVVRIVKRLTKEGYRFDSNVRDGVKLLERPDVLTPEEILSGLETRWMGRSLYSFKRATSTNDVAMKLAQNGVSEGTVTTAESQPEGRGRLGRSWKTTPGKSLAFSVVLRPELHTDEFPLLTLAAAVAVAETLRETGLTPEIKWPNDVMLFGKKVCGILTEMQAEQDRMAFAVVGIGININQSPEEFTNELRDRAASLLCYRGHPYPRARFLQNFLLNMEMAYGWVEHREFERVLSAWRQWSNILGQQVKVTLVNRTFFAQAVHVDEKGGLWVRNDVGFIERLTAGDVEILRLNDSISGRRVSAKMQSRQNRSKRKRNVLGH